MSARQSAVSLDANFQKLRALAALGGGGGAAGAPLSRYKFISGGTIETTQNGAIGTPYKTITEFLTPLQTSASIADATALVVGKLTPTPTNSYTEALTLPPYRSVEIRADNFPLPVVGNVTLHNIAGVGTHTSPANFYVLHNINLQGNIVVTDDGGQLAELSLSADEFLSAIFMVGNITANTTTALAVLTILGLDVQGTVNLGSAATSAAAAVENGEITGNLTAQAVTGLNSGFTGNITVGGTAGNSVATFQNCTFAGAPVLTGTAGTFANFDGPSWRSFLAAGGTLVGTIAIVQGGYIAGNVEGANLTNAEVSVSIDGTGASGGFTGGGNHYTLPAATLNAPHAVTLKTGGGEKTGDTILITRHDATADIYTVKNNAGAPIAALPVNTQGFVLARFSGADWVADMQASGA